MSSEPRVSIIVPVYDAGAMLERALESAHAQTFPGFEIVVVDDGSTDGRTRAILDAWAQRPGVSVHRIPNSGPAIARNTAIERARGEYVLPLDADDYLAPMFLSRTVAILDAEPDVGVVYTWIGLVGRHHGVWRTGGFTVRELVARCTIHVCSLYRRALWVDVGGYDARFAETCEDWDFWLGAAAQGWQGRCVPEVLAYYRRTPAGREMTSRLPGVKERLMRALVAKHRPLYEAHLEDAVAGMYERVEAAGIALERIYHTPPVRAASWMKGLLARRRP